MITMTCPECTGVTFVGADSIEEAEGATADCGHCDTEVIFHEGQEKSLHKHINSQNPEWPADGAGTGCVTQENADA